MPGRRGRRRRPRERRHRDGGPGARAGPMRQSGRPGPGGGPARSSLRARYAGFALAVLTMFLGVLTAAEGVSRSLANGIVLLLVGALLVALALALGALSLIPDRVRRLFEHDRRGG
jgi:hypothetical protein